MDKIFVFILLLFVSCGGKQPKADAYGNFEADERIISVEGSGRVLELFVEEGQLTATGQVLGRIDSTQLVLKIAQLRASMDAIIARSPDTGIQLSVYDRQLDVFSNTLASLEREQLRSTNLVQRDAGTLQQLDLLKDQIIGTKRQMSLVAEQRRALASSLGIQKAGLSAELAPLRQQILQLEDQLNKCRIIAFGSGTVLSRYVQVGEFVSPGRPIIKIADLDRITLKAYVSGGQLSRIKLGQKVRIVVDGSDDQKLERSGILQRISSKAEFTPKIIQTREDRVNLVYAIEIQVDNDGSLKIGMPGEVYF